MKKLAQKKVGPVSGMSGNGSLITALVLAGGLMANRHVYLGFGISPP